MKNTKDWLAFVLLVLFGSAAAHAGIVYTDIPDELVKGSYSWQGTTFNSNGDSYKIDLNNDSTKDIMISHGYSPMAGAGVDSYSDADGLSGATTVQSGGYVAALNESTLIGPSSTFGTGTLLYAGFPNLGNWGGQSNKYMGVKFKIGANWHYGWVRMSVAGDSAVTIHDFAYQTQPGVGIKGSEVPEPTTLTLLAMFGLTATRRRKA